MTTNGDRAITLREMIVDWRADEKAWKDAMLQQFRALNGTVATHTTSIALLGQADQNQNMRTLEACAKLDAGLERVRAVEMAQVKAGIVCGLIGAGLAAAPALLTALRLWFK